MDQLPPTPSPIPALLVPGNSTPTIDLSFLTALISLVESLARLSFHIHHRRICRFWCNRKLLARIVLFISFFIEWIKDAFVPIYCLFIRPKLYDHPIWLGCVCGVFLMVLVRVSWRKTRRWITRDRVVGLQCARIEEELLQERVG